MENPTCLVEMNQIQPQSERDPEERSYDDDIKRAVERNTLFPPDDEG